MYARILAALLAGWNASKKAFYTAFALFIGAALVALGVSPTLLESLYRLLGL